MKRVSKDSLDYPGDGWFYLDDEPFTGIAFSLYEDGTVESETEYQHGLAWGMDRGWFDPNQLQYEIEMQRGSVYGKKRIWYPDGKLKEEGDYEYGITLSRKTWDDDGNLVEDFELKETDSNFKLLEHFRDLRKNRKGIFRPK